ncbi:protein of unknown function [Streptomyces murinus]
MDKQSHALVNLTRARELLSREDALLGSSLVVGRLTREEIREISDLVAQRTLLYDISLPLLPASERERYERFWDNAGTAPLRSAEQSVIEHGSGTPDGVTAKSWDSAAGSALADLGALDDRAGDRFRTVCTPSPCGSSPRAPSRACSDCSPCSSPSSCPSGSAADSSATCADCAWRRTRRPASGCPA